MHRGHIVVPKALQQAITCLPSHMILYTITNVIPGRSAHLSWLAHLQKYIILNKLEAISLIMQSLIFLDKLSFDIALILSAGAPGSGPCSSIPLAIPLDIPLRTHEIQ
jgi:hypothetical protein